MDEKENNGFGPLYKQRGSRAIWTAVLILVASAAVVIYMESHEPKEVQYFYMFSSGLSILAWFIGEGIRRFCLFIEECRHRRERYKGSFKEAAKAAFDCHNYPLVVLVVVILSLWLFLYVPKSSKTDFIRLFLMNAICIPTLRFLSGLKTFTRVEYCEANERENTNIADGLAWGYYYGYLKTCLPILETQINSTEKYRDKLVKDKVYILIPKNCIIEDKISDGGLVKHDGDIEPLEVYRGGQRRIYRHAVYSIKEENSGRLHYCILEYATPLRNLHEMQHDSVVGPGLSRDQKDLHLNLFVTKLRGILENDPDCKDKYQLVVYDSTIQDIASLMLRVINDSSVEMDHDN